MAVETRKRKRKTHLILLTYIMVLIGGSSVWLKMMLKGGTRSGHPLSAPSWMRTFQGKYIVEDFDISVGLDHCEFKEPNPSSSNLEEKHYCGLGDSGVPVRATIGNVNRNMDGLFLTIHAAKDFDTWWQANTVLLPRELFRNVSRPMTLDTNLTLTAQFQTALSETESETSMPPKIYALQTAAITKLVNPMLTFFAGTAGAVTVDADRVTTTFIGLIRSTLPAGSLEGGLYGSIVTEATVLPTSIIETTLKYKYQITWEGYLAAYKVLQDAYRPLMEVNTIACLGAPGFVYVVGCVNSGKPQGGGAAYSTMCKNPPCKGNSGPPFSDCRAISTTCGATCGSAASRGAHAPHAPDVPRAQSARGARAPLRHCTILRQRRVTRAPPSRATPTPAHNTSRARAHPSRAHAPPLTRARATPHPRTPTVCASRACPPCV